MFFNHQKPVLIRFVLIFTLLGGMFGISPVRLARADTLIVTNTNDSGPDSLRQAIADAAPGDTITFAPSLAGGMITLNSQLEISKNLTIDGSELDPQLVLSGGFATRIMQITSYAEVTISGFGFTGGVATNGGAIDNTTGTLTVIESMFFNNSASAGGGAISVSGGYLTVADSTFDWNSTGGSGGAIASSGLGLNIKSSTLNRNHANADGGALYLSGNNLNMIVNSTIFDNYAESGGGIFAAGNTYTGIYNSIIAKNTALNGRELMLIGSVTLDLQNTIFVCTTDNDSCYSPGLATVSTKHSVLGIGTLNDYGLAEPADNGGPTQTMALLPGSPLIDAGDDAVCANPQVNNQDQRGVARPQGSHCDIGAYEDQALVRFVKQDATGTNDGSSWSNAHTDLQSALSAASPDEEIWVAAGTYKPTAGTDRTISFMLKNGVSVYGGFAGTETSRDLRDYETNFTVLSGDIGVEGDNRDNSYHVVVGSNTNHSAILDGFIVIGGNANGSSSHFGGGGMYNEIGSPTLTNLKFIDNFATFGGGIYNLGSFTLPEIGSHPVLTNVIFQNNSAVGGGGAMRNENYSNPILTNVIFENNSVDRTGGGIENFYYSSPILTDVSFINNTAGASGGGMFNWIGNNPELTNVTFSGNTAQWGGGMGNYNSSPTIWKSAFYNNHAYSDSPSEGQGGAIYNSTSNPLIENTTFSGNTAVSGGSGVANLTSNPIFNHVTFTGNWDAMRNTSSHPIVRNSIVWGNIYPDTGNTYTIYDDPDSSTIVADSVIQNGFTGGTNIITTDPLLGALGNYGGFTETIPLQAGSSAIDAGDDANCPATDQRGVTRPQGSGCDIGTYEVEIPNSAPTNIGLSSSAVNENQPAGTTVGTLSTTDPDAGDSHTYAFCGGTNDASFSILGNQLKTAAVFDYETKASYSVCIRSTDSGSLSITKTFVISVNDLVDTQTFGDVSETYWAWNFIERLYNAGITGGCNVNPIEYCPESTVTRAQMAVFLLRGIHGPSYNPPAVGASTGFGDVEPTYWAAAWIKQLAAEGITGGCGSGNYCPEDSMTRAQMAVFLLRAKYGASYNPPAVGASTGFGDVEPTYWAAAWIKQLAAEGITGGCGAGIYCPENPVNRAQMAVFLVKTFSLP